MSRLEALRQLARTLSREEFSARFPHGFLVHRPASPDAAGLDDDDDDGGEGPTLARAPMRFGTEKVRNAGVVDDGSDDDLLAALDGWIVAPVCKAEGASHPERMSVGRAHQCDVVLRYPSVSKLHAYLHLGEHNALSLSDYQSSNGSKVNGVAVSAGATLPVKTGDRLTFGTLELDLLPSPAAQVLLRSIEIGDGSE